MSDYDRFMGHERPPYARIFAKWAWALIGVSITATIVAEHCGNGCLSRALGDENPQACEYTIEQGDSLSELLELEGLEAEELEDEIGVTCRMNSDRMILDTHYPTTVFDTSSGYADCDRMRAGGQITVLDYNQDGFVGGQECHSRQPMRK